MRAQNFTQRKYFMIFTRSCNRTAGLAAAGLRAGLAGLGSALATIYNAPTQTA
jgi:hypothetical protein